MKKISLLPYLLILILLILTGCSMSVNINNNSHLLTPSTTPELLTPTPLVSMATTTPTPQPTVLVITTEPQTIDSQTTDSVEPSTTNYESRATEILKSMTLKEKVGQLFFVRCRNASALTDIKNYHLGGYILFAEDFKENSIDEMIHIIKSYQEASNISMLIGVDEEGGVVNRVSKFEQFRSTPFRSPQDLYNKGGFDLIKRDTAEKAQLLKSIGINVNLAPVCDVSTDANDFIYRRSFGKNAENTAKYVKTVVTEMNHQGIGCTLKHFPGYGNNVDTHTGIAIDNRSYNTFVKSDFIPFQTGIDAGAGSILVSHNIVKCIDKNFPASLSPAIHKLLREDLGFNGVIMTDDLSMDAIKQYTGNAEAAVLAITAGNDLIIATDFNVQIPAVMTAVKNKKITQEQLNESVLRILVWKLSLGIIS